MISSNYSIWALEFSTLPVYPDTLLLYGITEGSRQLPFLYYVLKSEQHTVMVDCGFADNEFGQNFVHEFEASGYISPEESLGRIGMTPADIDAIVITHHHFDHIGAIGKYPNATVWLQQREVESWIGKFAAPEAQRWLKIGLDPETLHHIGDVSSEGRMRLVNGQATVAPGLHIRPAYDTHTAGSQYLVLKTDDGGEPWVFTGDVVSVYDNLGGLDGDGHIHPIGWGQGSQECCVRVSAEMLAAANDDIGRILPSHELRLWERYPSIIDDKGMHVAEIALAPGAKSRIGQ